MPASRTERLRVFNRHAQRLERYAAGLVRIDRRYFWLRLGALASLGVALALTFLAPAGRLALYWFVVTVLAFIVIVYFHRKVDHSRLRAACALRLTKAQAARIELDWEGLPAAAGAPPGPEHPFGLDLDISGPHSLHQLVDTALTVGGSRRLQDWLLNPQPDAQVIAARQAVLQALAAQPAFRSRLALNGALASPEPGRRWSDAPALGWLQAHLNQGSLRRLLLLLGGLAVVDLLLFLPYAAGRLPPYWILALFVYAAAMLFTRQRYSKAFDEAYQLEASLAVLRPALGFLEGYPYAPGSTLGELCRPFWQDGPRPSRLLGGLGRILSGVSLTHNPVWASINLLAPWDLYFAYRLEQLKQALSQVLPTWLETWYELEALNSLANFAYLNPEYCFPAILPLEGQPRQAVFSARSLGHPLIPFERRVCNDFSFRKLGEVALVSGSNMSGKSSFLRTLGVNLCLAFAGGPAAAASLETVPFRLFTCINVSDSLEYGISYFYAEVRRLKALLDALRQDHPLPAFFLIDEIFRGTNNRERQAGSRAYLRALAGQRGCGVISTHDLELVRVADEIPEAANFHFRDEVNDGRMTFDYSLHPGPSLTTNALKIMKMEGLPAEEG